MKVFSAFISVVVVVAVMQNQRATLVESASLISLIPGASFLRDITYATLDTINTAVDQTLGRTIKQVDDCLNCFPDSKDPDTHRNVSEIIISRGFKAEEYDVITRDGYILTIQRIINPLVKEEDRPKLKPVIMQHGLMSSSVDWVINSFDVKPALPVRFGGKVEELSEKPFGSPASASNEINVGAAKTHDSQKHPNSLGFYMANEGYDVFLTNSRGNVYGQRHTKMSSWDPKFWAFSFDQQIKFDLPDTIEFIQRLTNQQKLGYVGHSQGTVMMFGLLSEQPEYADIIEPFIALAPVAYVNHSISPVKYFSVYTPVFQHINMWFATSNAAVKYLGPIVCGPQVIRRDICANIVFLSVGFNEEELDESRVSAYLAHMPSGTSVKNIAHYGQEVISGRFAKFDHGVIGNQILYNSTKSPDYDLSKIRSKSIALFIADNDWLASPIDVARLRASLKVEPFRVVNMTEIMPKWNHIDFVYGKHAGELINTKILQIFEHFEAQSN